MVGERLGRRNRLTNILQPTPGMNNGTIAGGLAHMLEKYLQGSQTYKDDTQYKAAQEALAKGLAPTTTPNEGEMGPIRPRGGNLTDALTAVQALEGNPYADQIGSQLGLQQAAAQQQQAALREQRAFDDQRYNQRTGDQRAFTADQGDANRRFSAQQAELDRANQTAIAEQRFAQQQQLREQERAERRVPAGYSQTPEGGLAFIPGGPADPANKAPVITAGQRAVDTAFGKEYAATFATGQVNDAIKQLSQLEMVAEELAASGDLTGPFVGSLPDSIGAVVNPRAIEVREQIEEVVQRNLRVVLGAQFTEKEGERLIARAYNPRLDEATNAKRVRRLVTAMSLALQEKQRAAQYFEQNGTLTGFAGATNFGVDDFIGAMEDDRLDGLAGRGAQQEPVQNAPQQPQAPQPEQPQAPQRRRFNPQTGQIE